MLAAPEVKIACLAGIAPWKRTRVRQLLGDMRLPVARNAAAAVSIALQYGGAIAVWATRIPDGLIEMAEQAAVPLWRLEDGFVRSTGLGAALHLPASIVLDRTGIYYDPSRPSDLETLFTSHVFSEAERKRADALIKALLALRITKYNLGGTKVSLPTCRRVALVIGQVADDASMRLGANGLTTADLIDCARNVDPDAFLVYKPHPDVVAGLRQGQIEAEADLVVKDADLLSLVHRADTIHVLSSLTGFEALLRGKTVHVHGQPFYAGWGLTTDHSPPPRRGRQLALSELVAGALIAYPRYCHPVTGHAIAVEELVVVLAQHDKLSSQPGAIRRWAGKAALAVAKPRG